ncbi:hypothetical protein CBR_g71074, partial [Chara braunii]
VGCGTTSLPGYFESSMSQEEFKQAQKHILEADRVEIRDPEHLYNYRVFKRVFGEENPPGKGRWGEICCEGCGFDLQFDNQVFCLTCGKYPARRKSPTDSPSSEAPGSSIPSKGHDTEQQSTKGTSAVAGPQNVPLQGHQHTGKTGEREGKQGGAIRQGRSRFVAKVFLWGLVSFIAKDVFAMLTRGG